MKSIAITLVTLTLLATTASAGNMKNKDIVDTAVSAGTFQTLAAALVAADLVTPIPNRLAVPIMEGIVEPVIANTEVARRLFPEVEPISYREAVIAALQPDLDVETRWSGALHAPPAYELSDREGMMREVRSLEVQASP